MTAFDRLREVAEDRLGIGIVPAERLELLEARSQQLMQFAEEVSELGYHQLGYFTGRPQELNPEHRKALAQKSRMAMMVDPLAGAEAELRTNFALGRGVGKPQANDPQVQKILDEVHSDSVNQEKLFAYEAQRHRSYQLLSDANLYMTAYTRGGRTRFGFLDGDTVESIVTDPEDEERPLYYLAARRKQVWDVEQDRLMTVDEMDETTGRPKLLYWPHWRNVDDYRKEVEEDRADGLDVVELKDPADYDKLGPGVVFHVRINRIGRTEFGTPPLAKTLRFYSAMNQLTEAQVQMQLAAASIVAKNVVKGTPETVARSASAILNQAGELASARFGAGEAPPDFRDRVSGPGAGLWYENESSSLEAVNLSSGAAQAAQTAQIVRAPIAAASQFGQHYLGDAGNANLATATTLELPTLMAVSAWQETLETMQRWAYDFSLTQAVRTGRLGGATAGLPDEEEETPASAKTLNELWLMESWDKEEAQRRTGIDLGYTLEMPYPGRRNLPEVAAMVTTVAAGYDAEGFNVPLRRALLMELATHGLQVADPQQWVDEVLPEDAADQKILDAIFQRQLDAHNAASASTPEGGTPPTPPKPQIAIAPRGKAGVDGGAGDRPKGALTGVPSNQEAAEEYLRGLAEEAGVVFDDIFEPLLAV